jgi:hypothetical protein
LAYEIRVQSFRVGTSVYGLHLTVTPFVVADKIVEIVQSKTWKLRHTVGPDAEPTLQYRASMTDEQWVDLQSVESDQEWPSQDGAA